MTTIPLLFDPIRFPDSTSGLRVIHKFGGAGTVVAYARTISEVTTVPVVWDQIGQHPTHVPATSLVAFGDTPFKDLYWVFSQRASLYSSICKMLDERELDAGQLAYETGCTDWWDEADFRARLNQAIDDHQREVEIAREKERRRIAEENRREARWRANEKKRQQEELRESVESKLHGGEFDRAHDLYQANCREFWSEESYRKLRDVCEEEQRAKELRRGLERQQELREALNAEVRRCLEGFDIGAADTAYADCREWWPSADYEEARTPYAKASKLVKAISSGSLYEVAQLHQKSRYLLSHAEVATLSHDKVAGRLAQTGMKLDRDQVIACAQPTKSRLIKARAGSGKTRTLAAIAGLVIEDEKLHPDQVLIVAFNKKAATEIGDRVCNAAGITSFRNARTFHSLAYKLADHGGKRLIFDDGNLQPSRRLQSRFIERVIHQILNPAFRERLYEFFRRELDQIDKIGSDLPQAEYFAFRRSMSEFSLGGENVKSSGEKFIADFLFEHGINYVYERVFSWNKEDRLSGSPYRPDFCFTVAGRDVILEHWAIDPADACATVPEWWNQTDTEQYRDQIESKRNYWNERGITFLETHTGMLRGGREAFEERLQQLLKKRGIEWRKLSQEVLVKRVVESPRTISRMTDLFLAFISRAKKMGWDVEETSRIITADPDPEPRNRIFHELALRAYAEYERLLETEQAMDFDDLLRLAAERVRKDGGLSTLALTRDHDIAIRDIRWLLIDEFQDFSELYFNLTQAILFANPLIRLVAVGDDWQAINAFAGAQLRFFNEFDRYFDAASTSTIATNYRSDITIVGAGNLIMRGHGQPALSSRNWTGQVHIQSVDKVWVDADIPSDKLCLESVADPETKKIAGAAFLAAKALKASSEFIVGAAFRQDEKLWLPAALVLTRTGTVHGMTLSSFEEALRRILEKHPMLQGLENQIEIEVMTAHKAKGREADTVIVLEAVKRQFPKVHADNQLFAPFGVSVKDTLAEERRLFYVAATRAKHRLLLLTESGQESAYVLELLGEQDTGSLERLARSQPSSSAPLPLGALAQAIHRHLIAEAASARSQ